MYGAVTKELTGKESGMQENEFMTYFSQMKRINQSIGTTFIKEEFNVKFKPNKTFSIWLLIKLSVIWGLSRKIYHLYCINSLQLISGKVVHELILLILKLIEKLAPGIDENRYQTAKAVNNRHKNRHSNILAGKVYPINI